MTHQGMICYPRLMPSGKKINFKKLSFPGLAITGVIGGLIGSFIGGITPILVMALAGALIGNVVWALGGQRFFVLISIGILLGSGLAIYISGLEAALLGAGTGGAIGGFVSVNLNMLRPRDRE